MTDYTWPDDLVPYAQSFYLQPHTGGSESPFSRVSKIYGLSAPRWICSMSFRGGYDGIEQLASVGPRLDGLIAKLRGRQNRVLTYDFRRSWRGPVPGGNLAAASGATSMTLTGLDPGDPVYAGDYVGGDGRPHIVTDDAVANGSGEAVVSFEPPLLTALAENAALFEQVRGTFRLTDDDAGQNAVVVGETVNMSLSLVEDPVDLLPIPLYGLTGLWVMADYATTPSASIPNRLASAELSTNRFRASRRLFANTTLWHAVNATLTDDAADGPDGVHDASTLVSTGADWWLAPYYANPTIPAGDYTVACNVKRNTGSNQDFAFTKDGRSTRSSVKTATSAWQRFSYSFTLGSTTAPWDIGICSKDGATNANLQIRDLELFPGSADLGPATPDTHIYLSDIYDSPGVYSGGQLSTTWGLLQFPTDLDMSAFTAQFCAEVTTADINGVLANAADYTKFNIASMGVYGPMDITTLNSIPNRIPPTGNSPYAVYQYPDLFDLTTLGTHVFTYRYDGAALELWIDDNRLFRDEEAFPTLAARDLLFNQLVLGNAMHNKFTGALALWSRALSDDEIRQAFAVQKNLSLASGVTITGDTTDRIYVAEGDSISGGNGQDCYPFKYGAHDSPAVIGSVFAVAGSTLAHLNARAAAVDAVIPPAKRGRKYILSVLIGANDLAIYPGASDAAAAAQYTADLAAYCDARRAAGFKVVVCTILPRGGVTAHNTRRAIVNANITGSWLGVHCDGIADFAADATMGPDAAPSNPTYYDDITHPSAAGHLILESIIRPVLNGL